MDPITLVWRGEPVTLNKRVIGKAEDPAWNRQEPCPTKNLLGPLGQRNNTGDSGLLNWLTSGKGSEVLTLRVPSWPDTLPISRSLRWGRKRYLCCSVNWNASQIIGFAPCTLSPASTRCRLQAAVRSEKWRTPGFFGGASKDTD